MNVGPGRPCGYVRLELLFGKTVVVNKKTGLRNVRVVSGESSLRGQTIEDLRVTQEAPLSGKGYLPFRYPPIF